MRGAPAVAIAGALGLGVLTATHAASAAVALSTELSSRKVEVGARFTLRLRAMSDGDDRASNPELKSLLQTGLKIFQGHEQHAEHVAAALK